MLAASAIGVLPSTSTGLLAGVDTIALIAVMGGPKFMNVSASSEDPFFIWWHMDLALQARQPWYHVCSPSAPQLPNQEPPRAQQLCLPDLWVPHLRHTGLVGLFMPDRVENGY